MGNGNLLLILAELFHLIRKRQVFDFYKREIKSLMFVYLVEAPTCVNMVSPRGTATDWLHCVGHETTPHSLLLRVCTGQLATDAAFCASWIWCRGSFTGAYPSQWLSVAGVLRQAHSVKMWGHPLVTVWFRIPLSCWPTLFYFIFWHHSRIVLSGFLLFSFRGCPLLHP